MSIFYSEHDTSSIYFHENIGTTTTPAFLDERISPFGLEGVTSASGDPVYQSSPEFVDFDGDGDLDVLVAHEHGFGYFANTGTPVSPAFSAQQHNPFGLFPNYDFKSIDVADLDNDCDLDIIAKTFNGNAQTIYYENTGSSTLSLIHI